MSGQNISCPYSGTLGPYEAVFLQIFVTVAEPSGTVTSLPNEASVEGGEAPRAASNRPLTVNGAPTKYGVESYRLTPKTNAAPRIRRRARIPTSSPPCSTSTRRSKTSSSPSAGGIVKAPGSPALQKDLHFVVPPGLIGNALAVPKCSSVDFSSVATGDSNYCPPDTAVGVAEVTINEPVNVGLLGAPVPLFNLEPAPGGTRAVRLRDRESARHPDDLRADRQRLRRGSQRPRRRPRPPTC